MFYKKNTVRIHTFDSFGNGKEMSCSDQNDVNKIMVVGWTVDIKKFKKIAFVK